VNARPHPQSIAGLRLSAGNDVLLAGLSQLQLFPRRGDELVASLLTWIKPFQQSIRFALRLLRQRDHSVVAAFPPLCRNG
jgi:hypothetical protein